MAPRKGKRSNSTSFSEAINSTLSSQNNITMTENQFAQLMNNLQPRKEKSTFSTCTARFSGSRNTTNVEDFIATILVYKEAEDITDSRALFSLPLLFEGYAASWWQGVKQEADSFSKAIELLRANFAPPKPDWRLFAEIFQDKQRVLEATDSFICKKRKIFALLSEKITENSMLNMLYSQLLITIRERIPRENIKNFQNLLEKLGKWNY